MRHRHERAGHVVDQGQPSVVRDQPGRDQQVVHHSLGLQQDDPRGGADQQGRPERHEHERKEPPRVSPRGVRDQVGDGIAQQQAQRGPPPGRPRRCGRTAADRCVPPPASGQSSRPARGPDRPRAGSAALSGRRRPCGWRAMSPDRSMRRRRRGRPRVGGRRARPAAASASRIRTLLSPPCTRLIRLATWPKVPSVAARASSAAAAA